MSHHEHHQGHAHEPYEFAVHHSEEEGKKIRRTLWNVFWILLIVTTIEVLLGIFWKSWGFPWHIVKKYIHFHDHFKGLLYSCILHALKR